MRVLRLSWLATAALLLGFMLAIPRSFILAQDDEGDSTPVEDAQPPAENAPDDPSEETPSQPLRRPRPKTEEEERQYKLQKTREDPYLNAPPAQGAPPFNPLDWVDPALPLDSSRYLVQDKSGGLLGTLSLSAEARSSNAGRFIRVSRQSENPAEQMEMWLFADTLKPRSVVYLRQRQGVESLEQDAGDVVETGEVPAAPEQERINIDYLFDRLTITRTVGQFTTSETMRQLPYSFVEEQLPLLVRQLRYIDLQRQDTWPFEALLTVPLEKTTRQLQIERPKQGEITSAEPQKYQVYELTLRINDETTKWWVERRDPHRLVKFERGGLTYTLHQYRAEHGESSAY